MQILYTVIYVIGTCMMIALYAYGFFYLYTALHAYKKVPKIKESEIKKRFAVLIPARNEDGVIGALIASLQKQKYPKELYDIIVIPNNCTDNTEQAAAEAGAKIMKCRGSVKSKGEVLSDIFDQLIHMSESEYDAVLIFDADNLVHPEFIAKMNDALMSGAMVAQGYRDSKNPSDTWVSGCHSVYYYIVNGFFNRARMALGWSAALNGTGFMISTQLLKEHPFETYSMTEDIEYSSIVISRYKEKIMWVPDAVTYDEQPLLFSESVTQRRRWTVGTVQCFKRYARTLLKNTFKDKNMSCLDMFVLYSAPYMQIAGLVPVLMTVAAFIHMTVLSIAEQYLLLFLGGSILSTLGCYAATMIAVCLVLKLEHKPIKPHWKAIFGFGIFLLSWLPIGIWALIHPKCHWREIKHTRSVDLDELMNG